ncbi:hypothetical protein L596_011451 [Steinernema carpocapsae]|uniref:Uncharacterized protein n=1 Tax=Steinernema carpocapsae TaxID=34508 RepID=A0A4U5NTX3_STECR|nr:hypothetical protein L596_011451 [Steinernema carpocapsae]
MIAVFLDWDPPDFRGNYARKLIAVPWMSPNNIRSGEYGLLTFSAPTFARRMFLVLLLLHFLPTPSGAFFANLFGGSSNSGCFCPPPPQCPSFLNACPPVNDCNFNSQPCNQGGFPMNGGQQSGGDYSQPEITNQIYQPQPGQPHISNTTYHVGSGPLPPNTVVS